MVQTGGGEQLEGGQDPSRRTFEVTIRRRTGLSSALRVCWGAVVMSVTNVRQDDTDREFAVLECVEEPGASR
jgi:head-tail adaptor